MPLPENHALLQLAQKALAEPDSWPETVAKVRHPNFSRQLAASGQFLPIATALFDTSPLGPKPYGFLAGALAFEMADASQPPEQAGITGTGRRALDEPFSFDELSISVRCDICTRLLNRTTSGETQVQRAGLHVDRAKCNFHLGDLEALLSDCHGAANILGQPLKHQERSAASKLALRFAHALYELWLKISLQMQEEKASQGMFARTRQDLENFEKIGSAARKQFEIYFQLDETDAKAHAEYADLTTDLPDVCMKHVSEALRLDEREPLANYMKGQSCRSQGDLERALLHFERAVDGAPNDPWHQSDLAETCFQLWQRKSDKTLLDRAIRGYEKAIALQPKNNDWRERLDQIRQAAGLAKR